MSSLSCGKVSYTLDEAAEATGYSKRVIQLEVEKNNLVPRYANSKPVIPASELIRWVESLPTTPPKRD